MNKLRILIAIILVVSFSSCKRNDRKITTTKVETKEISLLDTLKLKLNSGEKWIVNDPTQIGITKMDSIISAFKFNKDENFVNLGNNLSKQTSYIIKSCDMTGEAHDQLHVVLVPMLEEISVLKESQDTDKGKVALGELENSIAEYFNHFEN